MDIDEFIDNPEKFNYKIDIGKAILLVLQLSVKNMVSLETILESQIVLSKKIDGKIITVQDQAVLDKLHEVLESVGSTASDKYIKFIQHILVDED